MEKITDEELRAMLTKEDTPKEIKNKDTGETQWIKTDEPIDLSSVESLNDSLEQDFDFNTIPESIEENYEEKPLDQVLVKRNELSIGLSTQDIQDIFDYVSGKGPKPPCIDRFSSDAEGRLKDMTLIMSLVQLSQIPTLTALKNQVQERLFDPKNLYDMDSKTLSATMTNLNKDIMNILETSIKTVQTVNQFGSLNNEYRKILDRILMLPADKFELIQKNVLDDENSLEK